jgi:hypothetical protein
LSDYNNLDALAKSLAETKSDFYGGLGTLTAGPQLPSTPATTPAEVRKAEERFIKRLEKLKRRKTSFRSLTGGLYLPMMR